MPICSEYLQNVYGSMEYSWNKIPQIYLKYLDSIHGKSGKLFQNNWKLKISTFDPNVWSTLANLKY